MPSSSRKLSRMPELVRCPNCIAPLPLDEGPVARCRWCGAHVRLDAPAAVAKPGETTGARLAETIFFVSPARKLPWLEAGTPVPIHRTETLSTATDDQPTFHIRLATASAELAAFDVPIRHRGPRGTAKIPLTVRVSKDGAMSVTVAETPENAVDREGIRVPVVA